MERIACGHCGTQQIVERSGGAIHLERVADALTKVQAGTDKTAAELAIARLTNERQQLVNRRFEKEQYWHNVRAHKVAVWGQSINSKMNTFYVLLTIAFFAGAVPAGFVTAIAYNVALGVSRDPAQAGLVGFLVQGAGMMACAVLAFYFFRKSDKFNFKKLSEARDEDLRMLSAQISGDLKLFDEKIRELSAKIQKNHQIANG